MCDTSWDCARPAIIMNDKNCKCFTVFAKLSTCTYISYTNMPYREILWNIHYMYVHWYYIRQVLLIRIINHPVLLFSFLLVFFTICYLVLQKDALFVICYWFAANGNYEFLIPLEYIITLKKMKPAWSSKVSFMSETNAQWHGKIFEKNWMIKQWC